jgi:hypothetical protein
MLGPARAWPGLRVAVLPPRCGVVDPPCAPWREDGVGTRSVPNIDATRSPRGVEQGAASSSYNYCMTPVVIAELLS